MKAPQIFEMADVSASFSRTKPVLRNLNVQIPTDRRIALLGPNGAGKSTFLKVLAGAMGIRSGKILFRGQEVGPAELRRGAAWMPQNVEPIPGLCVREQVAFAAWAGGVSVGDSWVRADHALAQVNLTDLAHASARKISGGQQRRMALAEALAKDAHMLLLDEPTAGLDPSQRNHFRGILAHQDRGFMVSTHQIDDISEIFDFVIVLVSGQIAFADTLERFLGFCRSQGFDRVEDVFTLFVPSGRH